MDGQLKLSQTPYNAKPVLKWAGGKGQLLPIISQKLPQELGITIRNYAEPFFGGGALFFHLYNMGVIDSAILSDNNPELALLYRTIQHNPDDLVAQLWAMEKAYLGLDIEKRRQYYYQIRAQFNAQAEYPTTDPVRSSQILFLNRTCFNGLYRVNRQGQFNVPQGDYANPKICDSANIYQVSHALQQAEIICGDFECLQDRVNTQHFIYYDPPYRPLSKTSNFTAYSGAFGDGEQVRLARVFRKFADHGIYQMLSNSDSKDAKGKSFFAELYQGFNIHRVEAIRAINSNASARGKIMELLITNYDRD